MAQPTPAVLPAKAPSPKPSVKESVKESVYEDPAIPTPQAEAPAPKASVKQEISVPEPSSLDSSADSAADFTDSDDPEAELDRVFDQNELSSGKMMEPRKDVPTSVHVMEVPQTQTSTLAEPAQTMAEPAKRTPSDVEVQNTAETLAEIETESDLETIPAPAEVIPAPAEVIPAPAEVIPAPEETVPGSVETELDALEDSIPSVDAPQAPESEASLPQELPQEFPQVPVGDSDSLDSESNSTPQESGIFQPTVSQAITSPVRRMSSLKKALKSEKEAAGTSEPKVISTPNDKERSILRDEAKIQKNLLKNFPAGSIIQAAGTAREEKTEPASQVRNAEWVVVNRRESGIRLTAAEEPVMESVLAAPTEVDLNFTPSPAAVLPERPSYAQPADEYIIDSKSAGKKVELKENRKVTVSGVEVDDNWQAETQNETGTYIYYNGLQGRATIQSPDPVYIYAPRFRAVRQLVDLNVDEQITTTGDLYTPAHVSTANRNLETSTTKRNFQVGTDTTRTVMLQANGNSGTGILDGGIAPTEKTQEAVIAQENRKIAGPNAINGKTHAMGTDGLIEVNAWTHTEEMQVFIDQQSASAAIRTESTPALYTVREGDHKQDVRIYKVVSKTSAKPGETVDFIIYFENTGNTPVGNITLVDNLPARLEIVDDSAESSIDSSFTYEVNGNGSQTLRWEVTQPLAVGEKGAVKFKALVR